MNITQMTALEHPTQKEQNTRKFSITHKTFTNF